MALAESGAALVRPNEKIDPNSPGLYTGTLILVGRILPTGETNPSTFGPDNRRGPDTSSFTEGLVVPIPKLPKTYDTAPDITFRLAPESVPRVVRLPLMVPAPPMMRAPDA